MRGNNGSVNLNASGNNGSINLKSGPGVSEFTVGPTSVRYGSLFCVGPNGVWLGTNENHVEVLKDDLLSGVYASCIKNINLYSSNSLCIGGGATDNYIEFLNDNIDIYADTDAFITAGRNIRMESYNSIFVVGPTIMLGDTYANNSIFVNGPIFDQNGNEIFGLSSDNAGTGINISGTGHQLKINSTGAQYTQGDGISIANNIISVADNGITSDKIASDAITADKLPSSLQVLVETTNLRSSNLYEIASDGSRGSACGVTYVTWERYSDGKVCAHHIIYVTRQVSGFYIPSEINYINNNLCFRLNFNAATALFPSIIIGGGGASYPVWYGGSNYGASTFVNNNISVYSVSGASSHVSDILLKGSSSILVGTRITVDIIGRNLT